MNLRVLKRNIPFVATTVVCILLYVFAGFKFRNENFFSLRVFVNFFSENAFLGVAAVGMTFVILSGGIDLSVGGVMGLISVFMAILIEKYKFHPVAAIAVSLLLGTILGAGMGSLIRFFVLPPFLVTLAAMFLARGLALVISNASAMPVSGIDPITSKLVIPLGGSISIPATATIYFAVFIVSLWLAHFTRFGRNVYAIGGNEQSSTLMGLPVARTKIGVYAVSGFCSALAGIVFTFYGNSGDPTAGAGLELDAIAAVVIGGTLLSGGVGFLAGTFIGVLIFAVISTIITYANLNTWWTKMVIGGLLLLFILLQKLIQAKKLRPKT